jgi:CsoR family transcriptional regulator, copper-sensing transcriptional repressor
MKTKTPSDKKPAKQGIARPLHAAATDPDAKKKNLARLARIEGQIRGLSKMVTEDRYCPDIMLQVTSVQEALRSVSRELMKNHLKHCVTDAVRSNGQATEMLEEVLDLAFKLSR